MLNSFRISFSLKNTYRVNSIIYSIKQIPILKRFLPDTLYKNLGIKVFAMMLSAVWELMTAFLGKFLYIACMIFFMLSLYDADDPDIFTHIFACLTVIGAVMNTYMFDPTNDKYYAICLMRMDAKKYTLSNYLYAILKVVAGFLPFTLLFGLLSGVPLVTCLLMPFFVAGAKLISAAYILYRYEKYEKVMNENLPAKVIWSLTGIMLAAAYVPPYFGFVLPNLAFLLLAILVILAGGFCLRYIFRFQQYREMYQILLADKKNGTNVDVKKITEEQTRKMITQDASITSKKKGYEYFNELFVKRHQKLLWRAAKRVAAISAFVVAGLLILVQIESQAAEVINGLMLRYLPYFVFIMYLINRGTAITQAMFMNCDHSMLSYSFYRKPETILRLFAIRLREIVKINLLPAFVIAAGLPLILFFSGGTENVLNYAVLFISILSMSVFFSVHHLICYYLLQPYNVNTEIKSSTYQIVTWGTYMVCWLFINVRLDTLVFGISVTAFSILYCIIACVLAYQYAPKTFKLRA